MTDNALPLALEHKAAQAEAKRTAAAEKTLRAQVVEAVFGKELKTGMNTAPLGEKYELKAEVRPNVKLDEAAIATALQLMRDDGPLGAELADRLVKYKPELMLGEYKKLPEQYAALFEGAVTITQGSPSVELKDKAA